MKLAIRCVLAIIAVIACLMLVRNSHSVYAQSWGDSCSSEENECLQNGGAESDCQTQYNSCLSQRQGDCNLNSEQGCTVSYNDTGHSCSTSCQCYGGCSSPTPACPNPSCNHIGGCSFVWECDSPILVDVQGRGFHLTSQENGVYFAFAKDQKKKVAWTDPKFGNAWLALDRNGNGKIDDASELFGNYTDQPESADENGFAALAVFDQPENGGNGDGAITDADSVYSRLMLWTDRNQNGISEPNEMRTLAQVGLRKISLKYSEGGMQDRYGNLFRYRGHVRMSSPTNFDHLLYDVYLVGIN